LLNYDAKCSSQLTESQLINQSETKLPLFYELHLLWALRISRICGFALNLMELSLRPAYY